MKFGNKMAVAVSGMVLPMASAGHATAQIPAPPAPMPTIMAPPIVAREPQPVQSVRLILTQGGKTILNHPLRIGGRGNSMFSISEPASADTPQCPPGSYGQSITQQIHVTINPVRYGAMRNLYTINIRYSRPERAAECSESAERSVTLQQTFAWAGKPVDFKVSDDFQVRLEP